MCSSKPVYLAVPFARKQDASTRGAIFSWDTKKWFVPIETNLRPFWEWLPSKWRRRIAEADQAEPPALAAPRVQPALAASPAPPKSTTGTPPTQCYHGTSLQAIMAIQEGGFRVDLAGSNAEMALGRGVYVTTTLQTALKCAESNPVAGGVLHLLIDLGRCYQVRAPGLHQKTWAQNGYDSPGHRRVSSASRKNTACSIQLASRSKMSCSATRPRRGVTATRYVTGSSCASNAMFCRLARCNRCQWCS